MKLCFLAPSGYGKSTAINLLKKHYDILNIKIAEPLYELQKQFYNKIKIDINDKQDGELLQFYGMKIRKENPIYLLDTFKNKVDNYENDFYIITNDDCRPYDYEYLKELGFIFIKINGYKRDRCDHAPIISTLPIEWQNVIQYDYEINNFNDLVVFEKNILQIMEVIKNDRKVLRRTNSKKL